MAGGSGDLWMVMTVLGVIVLGAVIAWGLRRNRQTSLQQERVADAGAQDLYDSESQEAARHKG